MSGASDRCKLGPVGKKPPDLFSGSDDVRRERWIVVLQQRDELQQQKIVGVPERFEIGLEFALVVAAKLVEQVVDLILERDLGERTDGLGLAHALLERG